MAETAEVAASRLGGKPLAVPPVEAALGTPASAASLGEAEEPREPQGSHSRRAEPLAELLAVVLGAIEEPQRYLCIRQAGEAGAEAALAERWVGAQRLAAQEPPAGAAAGTTS